jgi:type IV secretion system protein VirB6/type IV secretion system protein TrbL
MNNLNNINYHTPLGFCESNWVLKRLFWIIVLFSASTAYAAPLNPDVFGEILTTFSRSVAGWETVIVSAATRIFYSLALISLAWTGINILLNKGDFSDVIAETVRFIMFTGFNVYLLQNAVTLSSTILTSFRQLGGDATGLTSTFSPSSVLSVGFSIYDRIVDQSAIMSPTDAMATLLLASGVLSLLALSALNMFTLILNAWFLTYAGIIFLGFGGGRWTSDIAINYYKTILVIGAQFLAMQLVLSVGHHLLDTFYTALDQTASFKDLSTIAVVALVMYSLTSKMPQLFSSIISGASLNGDFYGRMGAGQASNIVNMGSSTTRFASNMFSTGISNAAGGGRSLASATQFQGDRGASEMRGAAITPASGSRRQNQSETSVYGQAAGLTERKN